MEVVAWSDNCEVTVASNAWVVQIKWTIHFLFMVQSYEIGSGTGQYLFIVCRSVSVIATSYLKKYSYEKRIFLSTEIKFGNSRIAKHVTPELRFDGVNHFLTSTEKKTWCALYGGTTKRMCTKCKVKVYT